jgi:hypothetical protein
MDPIGFGFEHYDGIGKFRTLDNGLPVNSASQIKLDGTTKNFADAIELSRLLAQSAEVRNCFVRQWTRFAFSRAETDADQASLNSANATFVNGNYSVRELLVGVALSRSFRYRSLAAGEQP